MSEVEGFFAPIRKTGFIPSLVWGVSRKYFMFNVLFAMEMVIVARVWELAWIPVVIHVVGMVAYKYDPDVFEVLVRYIRSSGYLGL